VAGGNSTLPTSPKTGDPNDVRVLYLLLIASLGGLGLLVFSKKKEN
jgi:LPXTG-motif cell wall-anchored protein